MPVCMCVHPFSQPDRRHYRVIYRAYRQNDKVKDVSSFGSARPFSQLMRKACTRNPLGLGFHD